MSPAKKTKFQEAILAALRVVTILAIACGFGAYMLDGSMTQHENKWAHDGAAESFGSLRTDLKAFGESVGTLNTIATAHTENLKSAAKVGERLERCNVEIQTIRREQIRQGVVLETVSDTIKEIKDDLPGR